MVSNATLTAILEDWRFEEEPSYSPLEREVLLPDVLHHDLALIIQGVRRCGKSTLLSQLPKHYDLPLEQCYCCNFEDPRLLGYLDYKLLGQIVSIAREKFSKEKPCYFFFDEIQNIQEWEKWLHTQLERPKNNYFILTGSNASLLSGEFGTALTGRHISLELYPFSFSEYQCFFPKKSLKNYLLEGGFPRAITFEKPYQLLQEYFNDIIFRDVLKRVHSRTPDAIKQVVKMTFDTCGSQLSYRKIAAAVGLTVDTVKTYLEACEHAYLLFACPFFTFSEKKRQIKQKKYYPIDTGLRYAITSTKERDLGKSLEILTFLHLKKNYEQVFYWEEPMKGEVDFVVVDKGKTIPYQVTWKGPEPRHEKALENFYETFPDAEEAVFITEKSAESFFQSRL